MKIVRFFNNMNMRSKMLFIYFAFILIPFFITGLLYTSYVNDTVTHQAMETMKSRTLNYTQNLNSCLMSYSSLTGLISNNTELMKELEDEYGSVIEALSVYQKIWNQYSSNVKTWQYVRNITIYSENPTMRNSFPYFFRVDTYMKDLPEYSEIISCGYTGKWYGLRKVNRLEYWNPANTAGAGGRVEVLAYNRVMYSSNLMTVPIGILTIEIDSRALSNIIKSKGDLNIFLFDENWNFIMSSGMEWKNEYSSVLPIDEDTREPVRVELDGYPYYMGSSTIENGWKLAIFMSTDDILKSSNTIRDYGGLLLVCMSCVIIPMIMFFSVLISNRTRGLYTKMQAFMGGDMVLGDPIGGKDEIGLIDNDFTDLARELKRSIDETYVLQLQKNRFHLQTLQSQINPHFLYNTLSTIVWLSDNNPREDIRAAVENLAAFYRMTLSKGRDIITLAMELEGVTAYLELQKVRYLNRISVYFQIDKFVTEASIPKLTIQPLLENSIRHGMNGEREHISIMISANVTDSIVNISIEDDGVGMTPERLEGLLVGNVESEEGNGLGFSNINDRIKLYFGQEYGLSVRSEKGCGTAVTIRFPFNTVPENEACE